jgi:hypothetical protein
VGTNQMLRDIAANPEAYLGRRVVIVSPERFPSGSYREAGFDHFAGEGE